MKIHADILTAAQQRALRRLGPFALREGFYLGGGTAVALQLGHRLAASLRQEKIPFVTGQAERGTLHGRAYRVQLSFFEYAYPLLKPAFHWREVGCPIASLADLACMKLAAIAQRGSKKDFIDLYALGQKRYSLTDMLAFYRSKYDVRDIGHILYGLSYFDEAEKERMPRMIWNVDWKEIRKTVQGWVKSCAR
ncbi:MAG: hypothetical protein A4E67_01646 [Syntrophaceae bacterium PtaB.Bin038]|nr:MAG: hypothetical protein A4E67_01646 [Syntrophaceae bacterium PtaB.Bin038]